MPLITLDDLKKTKATISAHPQGSAITRKPLSTPERDQDSDDNLEGERVDRDDSPFEPEQENFATNDSGNETTSKKKSKGVNLCKMRSKESVVMATTRTQANATEVEIEDNQALIIRELRKRQFESLSSKEPDESGVHSSREGFGEDSIVKRGKHDKDLASMRTGRTRQGAAYNWDGKYGGGRSLKE